MKQQPLFQFSESKISNMLVNRFLGIKLSIQTKILISFCIVILLMVSLNIVLMVNSLKYNDQYNAIVSNITTANSINGVVKIRIDTEMWDIVAGKTRFDEGKQYEIINEVNDRIRQIMDNVNSEDSRTKLDVIVRTMGTLKRYVDLMGEQIRQGKKVEENEKVLENIRGVSELIEDDVQEFALFELKQSEKVKLQVEKSFKDWVFINVIVLFCVLLFSIIAAWLISESISNPIKDLQKTTAYIAEEELSVKLEDKIVDEIAGLGQNFNIMKVKIKELVDNRIKEQENLRKSELKAMQAQINPHFLYNTLDTIVWMTEGNKNEQVIEIVRALSNFFRITLSKGKEWITIKEEIEHIKSYLIIQKMRYRDILDFKIEVEEDILDSKILKLTLQPLVENALYHGIKNRREGGTINIKGSKLEDNRLEFQVIDNGMGMAAERLVQIREELDNDSIEPVLKDSGFGLANVHRRIKLYYGKQYGITIESEYRLGTNVSLVIPVEK